MTKPYDVNNERSVLAGVLLDREVRRKVLGFLRPEEFKGEEHRAIYTAVIAASDEPELDVELLLANDESGKVERGLVEDLMARVGVPTNLDFHLKRMRQDYLRTAVISDAERMIEMLKDRTHVFEECKRQAGQVLSRLADVGLDPRSGTALAESYMDEFRQRCSGTVPFRSTGYMPLDGLLTEGFAKKRVTVLCGRPRNGKSSVVVDLVTRLLRLSTKPRILMLPLESGRERFIDMMVCNATGIQITTMTKEPQTLTLAQRTEVDRNVAKLLGDDRLTVPENPFVSLSRWNNDAAMDKTEELYATGGFDVVITDLWARKLTRHDPEEISKALFREQTMCQKYNVHSIMVHQLSRKVEERKDKRPELTDLKGSGAWEEVADLVLGIHRERVYKPHMRKDTVEFIILKQRLGDAGDVMEADFEGGLFRLANERTQDVAARKPRNAARFAADDDEPV